LPVEGGGAQHIGRQAAKSATCTQVVEIDAQRRGAFRPHRIERFGAANHADDVQPVAIHPDKAQPHIATAQQHQTRSPEASGQ